MRTLAQAAVLVLLLVTSLRLHFPLLRSSEYQDFIDSLPVDRFIWDVSSLGPTDAIREPALSAAFDWLIHWKPQHDRLLTMQPSSVLAYATELHRIRRDYGALLSTSSRNRTLVVWGDQLLSWQLRSDGTWNEEAAWLWHQFANVNYEAKDVPLQPVRTAPMGLSEGYLRGGVWRTAATAISRAALGAKRKGILATEGLHVPLQTFVEKLPPPYAGIVASRVSAVEWARAAGGLVELRTIPALEWWGELATYAFLLSPVGMAVQAAKAVEALLVLTIPIVQRVPAMEDLSAFGFPFAIVDTWENITAAQVGAWWKDLSPRLESFRRNCLTVGSYWKFYTGQSSFCA